MGWNSCIAIQAGHQPARVVEKDQGILVYSKDFKYTWASCILCSKGGQQLWQQEYSQQVKKGLELPSV